eukprot:283800-Rhodomonas_salina.2
MVRKQRKKRREGCSEERRGNRRREGQQDLELAGVRGPIGEDARGPERTEEKLAILLTLSGRGDLLGGEVGKREDRGREAVMFCAVP